MELCSCLNPEHFIVSLYNIISIEYLYAMYRAAIVACIQDNSGNNYFHKEAWLINNINI